MLISLAENSNIALEDEYLVAGDYDGNAAISEKDFQQVVGQATGTPVVEDDEEDPTEGSNEDPTEGSNEDPTEGSNEEPSEGSNEDPTEDSNEDPTEDSNEDPSEGSGEEE